MPGSDKNVPTGAALRGASPKRKLESLRYTSSLPGSEKNGATSPGSGSTSPGSFRGTSPKRTLEMMRNSNSFPLLHQVLTRKKSDQKAGGSTKGASKSGQGRASPLMAKKSLPISQETSSQSVISTGPMTGGVNQMFDDGATTGASSEDLVIDNGSDTGTDEVDSGESSTRTKQVISTLHGKIQKTKDSIKKEQNTKEAIVNEYLQMASEKQPTARIKALFEKKNQKSAQNIVQLQRKLENYQHRLAEIETHGYTGHKQAKEVLRDVGQGLKDVVEGVIGAKDTIVSKPKEFAHLIKNKFGSADNIAQLKLDDPSAVETQPDGKSGGTLPASFKYASDDDNSSVTSGSGPQAVHNSPHHNTQSTTTMVTLSPALLEPITDEISEVRESSRKVNDILLRLAEEFEDYKVSMQSEVSVLRTQLDDEKFRVERLEEQLNDLTELHQHEMQNLKQDLTSMEEKIEYRLDERTTDLSDLVDNASTRIDRLKHLQAQQHQVLKTATRTRNGLPGVLQAHISRLEQQQQQQQILSMEMVENATFRTIISKLINVVLALLAVVLVFVSTAANFLSPFVHSTSRLLISLVAAILAWLVYQNYSYIEAMAQSIWNFLTWPWS